MEVKEEAQREREKCVELEEKIQQLESIMLGGGREQKGSDDLTLEISNSTMINDGGIMSPHLGGRRSSNVFVKWDPSSSSPTLSHRTSSNYEINNQKKEEEEEGSLKAEEEKKMEEMNSTYEELLSFQQELGFLQIIPLSFFISIFVCFYDRV